MPFITAFSFTQKPNENPEDAGSYTTSLKLHVVWIWANLEMSPLENGKRRKLFYDFAAALDDLEFSRAFGPGILAAFFYGIVSGSMSFVNKVSKSQELNRTLLRYVSVVG